MNWPIRREFKSHRDSGRGPTQNRSSSRRIPTLLSQCLQQAVRAWSTHVFAPRRAGHYINVVTDSKRGNGILSEVNRRQHSQCTDMQAATTIRDRRIVLRGPGLCTTGERAGHNTSSVLPTCVRRCLSTFPPAFTVTKKWLPRSLYRAQNKPCFSITSRNPAITVRVDSSSTNCA